MAKEVTPGWTQPVPDASDCPKCKRDSCEGCSTVRQIEIQGVGTVHIVGDPAEIKAPRGRVWTGKELSAVKAVGMSKEDARIVADVKVFFDGTVEESRSDATNPTT
jgi:hypothetical protein